MKDALQSLPGKVEKYCYGMDTRVVDRMKEIDAQMSVRNKELLSKLEAFESDISVKLKHADERVNELSAVVNKDVNMYIDVADLKVGMREQEIGHASLKIVVSEVTETLKELKKTSMSYKDVLQTPSSNVPVNLPTDVPKVTTSAPVTRCIVKAPRGFIQGRSAMLRAQDFNIKVMSKMKLVEGHFSLPEATGLVQIDTKEGVPFQMWLAYFNTASDVSKLFAYKSQLKEVCPAVYVQPDLPKEVRMQRKLLVFGAKQFVQNQASPGAWRFKWAEQLKIVMNGPSGAKRFVVIEEGAAKVVTEGNIKVTSKSGEGRRAGTSQA